MARYTSTAVAVAVLFVLMAGCGGGGDRTVVGPGPPDDGIGESLEIGPLVVQTEKTAGFKAVEIPGNWSCSFVALYGAQIHYLASTALLDRVVFRSPRGGAHNNIYMCNIDGSGMVQLTNNNAEEGWPRWSPDGTRIVFERHWPGPGQWRRICIMNADGTGEVAISSPAYNSRHPEWSPDGGRIAFANPASGIYDVHTMYADGSGLTNITNNATVDWHPAWSPDGSTLAFTTWRYGGNEIAKVDAYGGTVTRLTDVSTTNTTPAWQPIGASRLAYSGRLQDNREIITVLDNGTDMRNFTCHPGSDNNPRYSTDGTMIVFRSDRAGNDDIWIREVVPPHRQWQVTNHYDDETEPDLGSPTKQTDRVLIGPAGSDRGADPVYPSAPAAIAAYSPGGYRNLVRIGVAAAHTASLHIQPMPTGEYQACSPSPPVWAEVSATSIANLRQDDGWGRPPTLWDFSALNPGMVLLYFNGTTGKLAAAVPVKDAVYSTVAGADKPAYTSSVQGDGLVVSGDFPAVFDGEGRNLAPNGASSVRLSKNGDVLDFN